MKTFAFGFVFAFLSYSSFCQQRASKNDSTDSVIGLQTEYPGGLNSLYKFINKNLKYPKQVSVEGKVYVRFIVNVDGSLSDFEVMKSLCDECDKNAIDVLKKMPKWIPGKINGKIARTHVVIPIAFSSSK